MTIFFRCKLLYLPNFSLYLCIYVYLSNVKNTFFDFPPYPCTLAPFTINNFDRRPLLIFNTFPMSRCWPPSPSSLALYLSPSLAVHPVSFRPPLRVALVVVVISSYAPWVFMQMVYFSPASFRPKCPARKTIRVRVRVRVCVCLPHSTCMGVWSGVRAACCCCWWKLHVISRIHDPFHW